MARSRGKMRPMKRAMGAALLSASALGACLFATSPVAAQAAAATSSAVLGMPGTWLIAGEDMMGYFSEHRTFRAYPPTPLFPQGPETTLSQNRFSFALRNGARVGVYYFLFPSFTLGGVVGFETKSGSDTHEDTPGTWTHDGPTAVSFLMEPKAGYLFMMTPVFGFWFRGGLGFRYDSQTYVGSDNKTRDSAWFVSADILFLAALIPHCGVFVGPTADVSFAGNYGDFRPAVLAAPGVLAQPGVDWTSKESYNRLGATIGFMGYF
jgi:hypothetical protein